MNVVLLHDIDKSYLENKKPSRDLGINSRTKIYFMHPRFRKKIDKRISIFEVGLWTFSQKKEHDGVFSIFIGEKWI